MSPILTRKRNDQEFKTYGIPVSQREEHAIWGRMESIVDDPTDNIDAGNFKLAEIEAFDIETHPGGTFMLWAPLSILEILDTVVGDASHDCHANAREAKRDPGRKALAPGYLADARMWSAIELRLMLAIAEIKGKAL